MIFLVPEAKGSRWPASQLLASGGGGVVRSLVLQDRGRV
jgi:hypothetical protein